MIGMHAGWWVVACIVTGTSGSTGFFPAASVSPAVSMAAEEGAPASDIPRAVAMKRVSGRTWNFEKAPEGKIAEGFVAAKGTWIVTTDDTAPSGNHVLAQSASNADDVFNVALIAGTRYQNLDLSVKLRAIQGRVDQGGGLVWRARDARNYYIARYNPLEDNFRVYKVEDGRRRMLDSARVQADHQAWHTLRVVMNGDHITCYLDGESYLDVHDTTFPSGGQIGLWSKADARTHFDDLTVAGPDETGATP